MSETCDLAVLYGEGDTWVNVTQVALEAFFDEAASVLRLPATDPERALVLGDPAPHRIKTIRIQWVTHFDNLSTTRTQAFPSADPCIQSVCAVSIDPKFCQPAAHKLRASERKWFPSEWLDPDYKRTDPNVALKPVHQHLKIRYGSFQEELPEQRLASLFVQPSSRVLELGGNIGRNSLVIATLLENQSHLVSLESHPEHVSQLTENRNLNGYTFQIEPSALSAKRLMQYQWNSSPLFEPLPATHIEIQTITWAALQQKYNLAFDTLVADCEGALFHILNDTPEMLDNFQTLIVENDYPSLDDFHFVASVFRSHGFACVHEMPLGYPGPACANFFYQVWKK